MKRILLALALLTLSIGGTIYANDWTPLGNNLYRYDTDNGSWLYRAYRNCYGDWCYTQLQRIDSRINVESDSFEKDVLRFAEQRERRADRLDLLRSLGIKAANGYNYGNGNYANGYTGAVTDTLTYISQAFPGVQIGSTAYGLASYPAATPDYNLAVHEYFRAIGRVDNLHSAALGGAQALASQEQGSNERIATVRAVADGYVSAVSAAYPAQSEIRMSHSEPSLNRKTIITPPPIPQQQPAEQPQQNQQPDQGYQDNPSQPPPAPVNPQSRTLNRNQQLLGQVVINNKCANCHGNEKPKGDLNFLAIDTFAPDERRDIAGKVQDRINSHDPARHMPKNGGELSGLEKSALIARILGG
jgi:hypothetical protein